MFFVDAPFPPGTVVVLSHELSRYSDFSISLMRLQAPVSTRLWWQKGVEIARSLNDAIEHMYGEWIFILGDDHDFYGKVILRLLETEADVIAPVCAQRVHPFNPVAYTEHEGRYYQRTWASLEPHAIMEMDGVGSAGMLVRKRVLDAIGSPWFEAGRLGPDTIGEDLWFCRRARDLGFKVYLDTRQSLGHITPTTIRPVLIDGELRPMAGLNGSRHRMHNILEGHTAMIPGQAEEE